MAFPIGLITRIVKPVLGLVISKDPTGQDSTMSKNWRPVTAVVLGVLFVLSVFGVIELSDTELTAVGAIIGIMAAGRSWEKKAVEKAIQTLKDLD